MANENSMASNVLVLLALLCTLSIYVNFRQHHLIDHYRSQLLEKDEENHSSSVSGGKNECDLKALMEKFSLDFPELNLQQENLSVKFCEGDCLILDQIKANWNHSQKSYAAFYYLIKRTRVDDLIRSLQELYVNFNHQYLYPVILFHESDMKQYLGKIKRSTTNPIFFQQVLFTLPKFLNREVQMKLPCPGAIGYRHMSRFHAKTVYEYPIICNFDYLFRLDDDSHITQPIDFDIFKFMRDNDIQYGYRLAHYDLDVCTEGLWEATSCFVKLKHIEPTFYDKWPRPKIFYNNFEISKTSFWLSPEYQRFINFIDQLGGIFYNRWGDAPIKSLAVSLFLNQSQIHCFKRIGYQHGNNVVVNKKLASFT